MHITYLNSASTYQAAMLLTKDTTYFRPYFFGYVLFVQMR